MRMRIISAKLHLLHVDNFGLVFGQVGTSFLTFLPLWSSHLVLPWKKRRLGWREGVSWVHYHLNMGPSPVNRTTHTHTHIRVKTLSSLKIIGVLEE